MRAIRLVGGLVVDPAAGTARIGDVVLRDGRITSVSTSGPEVDSAPGDDTIVDVRGLVVGPGFIDLHSHVHSVVGQRLQAFDGVTTALDLESGLMPLERAYAEAAREGRPLNYGFSASWGIARAVVLTDAKPDATHATALAVLGDPRWQRDSTRAELDRWLGLLQQELDAGGLGIGVLQGYAPTNDPAEFLAVARLAAAAGRPVFSHVRELVEADRRTPVDGAGELVIAATETGARMHHCHVTARRGATSTASSSPSSVRARPARTSPTRPIPTGPRVPRSERRSSPPELLGVWGVTQSDIVVLGSGERPRDARRLAELRDADPGAPCIVEFINERDPADAELLRRALSDPATIVASDAVPVIWPDGTRDTLDWPPPLGGATHPRTAGTFSRAVRIVRESGDWDWVEVFRRCSLLPATVLDNVGGLSRRGRLQPGAAADIVVLDPATVSDRATYADPTTTSTGVKQLIVGGVTVISDGVLNVEAMPGQALRA